MSLLNPKFRISIYNEDFDYSRDPYTVNKGMSIFLSKNRENMVDRLRKSHEKNRPKTSNPLTRAKRVETEQPPVQRKKSNVGFTKTEENEDDFLEPVSFLQY